MPRSQVTARRVAPCVAALEAAAVEAVVVDAAVVESASCSHCGLPVPSAHGAGNEPQAFCCAGCEAVFFALAGWRARTR